MPDMNQLEMNGVVYDVRDPTKAPSDVADNKALSLTMATQTNYTVNVAKAYSRAGVVDVHLSITVVEAASTWITIATLPSDACPPYNIYEDVPYFRASSNYENIRMRITTSGAIQIYLGTAGVSYAFHDTFVSA